MNFWRRLFGRPAAEPEEDADDETTARISAQRTIGREEFGREFQVWTACSVVCRPTEKEALDYARYYILEKGDWDAVANRLAGTRSEAEDLVQDTLLKAFRSRQQYRAGTNPRAWLIAILRNTFLTSRKGLKVTMTVPLDFDEKEEGPEPAIQHDTPEILLWARSSPECDR